MCATITDAAGLFNLTDDDDDEDDDDDDEWEKFQYSNWENICISYLCMFCFLLSLAKKELFPSFLPSRSVSRKLIKITKKVNKNDRFK